MFEWVTVLFTLATAACLIQLMWQVTKLRDRFAALEEWSDAHRMVDRALDRTMGDRLTRLEARGTLGPYRENAAPEFHNTPRPQDGSTINNAVSTVLRSG